MGEMLVCNFSNWFVAKYGLYLIFSCVIIAFLNKRKIKWNEYLEWKRHVRVKLDFLQEIYVFGDI